MNALLADRTIQHIRDAYPCKLQLLRERNILQRWRYTGTCLLWKDVCFMIVLQLAIRGVLAFVGESDTAPQKI